MTTTEYPLSRYRIGVCLFFFIQGLTFAAWAGRIPDVKMALGLNDAELGALLLAIPIGQIAFSPVTGWLVGKYGSRCMLHVGFTCYPGSLLLLGLASSAPQLVAALLIFGASCNVMNISINTQAVSLEGRYGRSIMASFHGMWSLGGFAGGLASMLTAYMGFCNWEHFVALFAVGFALALTFRRYLLPQDIKKAKADDETPKRTGLSRFRLEGLIVMLGLVAFGCSVCEGAMYDWSVEYFRAVVRPDESLVRVGYVCCMFAMTMGRFTADRFVRRWGGVRVVEVCGAIVAVGLLLAVCVPQLIAASVGMLLVGAGVSAVVPLCFSMVSRSRTMHAGAALAVVSSIGMFGFLAGPPMVGFLSHAFGTLQAAFLAVAAFGVLTSVLARGLKG